MNAISEGSIWGLAASSYIIKCYTFKKVNMLEMGIRWDNDNFTMNIKENSTKSKYFLLNPTVNSEA